MSQLSDAMGLSPAPMAAEGNGARDAGSQYLVQSAAERTVPAHDKETAREYLAALDTDATSFTFQFFSDDREKRYAEIFHGTLDEAWPKIEVLNTPQHGVGVFVTVNETDGKGRSRKNMVRVRAFMVDADNDEQVARCEEVFADRGVTPNIVSKTRNGKHYFFRVDDVRCDEFTNLQQELIERLGTDKAVKDLTRVMRLAGTYHLKNPQDPHLVTLERANQHPYWTKGGLAIALGFGFAANSPVNPVQAANSNKNNNNIAIGDFSDPTYHAWVQQHFGHLSDRLSDGLEPDLEAIRSATEAVQPATISSEPDWVKLARALAHHAAIFPKFEPELYTILDGASRRAPGYDEEENRRRWIRYKDEAFDRQQPITIATAFDLAKKDGWLGYLKLAPSPVTATVTAGPAAPVAWSAADLRMTFSNIRHRRMLYGIDLVRGEITVLGSPGGVGKSSLAIGMAISIVTGKEFLDEKIRGSGLKALLINAEDSTDEIRRRVWAFCLAHQVAEHDLDRLYAAGADDRRVQALSFLRTNEKGHSELDAAGLAQLRSALQSLSPDVIILDPLVALCASGNMNDNPSMSLVIRALKALAAEFDCAILIVHHTRKNAEAGTADAISGAASIVNLARRAIMPVTVSAEEATTLGILPSERLRHFKLIDAKSNLAPRSTDVPIYRLHSVELPNAEPPTYPFGDNVQAVARVRLPLQASAAASMDDQKIRRAILDLVACGKVIDGKVYLYSPNTTGAKNVRSILDDAVAAARSATAPRQWAPGDLEAVVATTIKKLQEDGTLVSGEITGTGRFRRGQGLQVNPSLMTNGGPDATGTKAAA
jgi:hypothetical protein